MKEPLLEEQARPEPANRCRSVWVVAEETYATAGHWLLLAAGRWNDENFQKTKRGALLLVFARTSRVG